MPAYQPPDRQPRTADYRLTINGTPARHLDELEINTRHCHNLHLA